MEQIHILAKKIENQGAIISHLQKNNHLLSYAAFNKVLFKLTEHMTELENLAVTLNHPVEPIFAKKDFQKQSLIFQYKHLIGILNLIFGEDSKKIRKIQLSDKKLEKIEDKKLLKLVRNSISFINQLCGFSLSSFDKITSKAIGSKLNMAEQLSEEYGLTEDKIHKLENTSMLFTKSMIEAELASKQLDKATKRIKKLLESNEKIFNNKTDKFIELFEKPESNFAKNYKNLRNTEDTLKKEKKQKHKKIEELN